MSIVARAVLRPHLVAAVTLALALLATVVSAFTVRVAPHTSTCFYEDLRVDQKTLITFQVGEGGSLDVDFWVSDPNDAMLQLDHRVSQGTYQLIPSIAGKYTYCFSNQMSSISEKLVQFSVRGADVPPVDPKGT
ncbi:p24 complex component [Allomyces arbusculus]|nr:p24 complex component [Allomyces arbusculus]